MLTVVEHRYLRIVARMCMGLKSGCEHPQQVKSRVPPEVGLMRMAGGVLRLTTPSAVFSYDTTLTPLRMMLLPAIRSHEATRSS